ncbi:sensor histidine kinase [Pseudofrankia inefficax]|uniref:Oxygen sensor histidine kinase NreB n=1 Tax=Pseudofrankia inefficax (strain DSM 45817 / CECT 9037 / DDB 130130 / EuI1c) TaxID=298654 RepID=E3JCD3_PSEI1|nr:histidine kinase [Pseudofrankia inefficax]ADP84722.1 integral membrane sensor signal transduction histidine kinase [Pseudofrankia inefficax]
MTSGLAVGRRAALACALAGTGLTVALVGAGVALTLTTGRTTAADEVMAWWLSSAVAALGYGLLGGWLAARRPRLSIGWLLLAIGLGHGLALAGPGWLVHELAASPARPRPLATAAMWVGNATWMAAVTGTATVLPLLLPDGRPASRRWRPVLLVAVAVVVCSTAQAATVPYGSFAPALERRGIHNPAGVSWASSAAVTAPLALLTAVTALVALWSLWRRARARPAADERERRQVRWILLGLGVSVVLFAAGFWLGPVLTALAMLPLPAACVVAAHRYQLWDVDLVVSRALAYGALTVVIGVCYAACVGLVGGLLGRTTGAPLLATALVAVFVEPLARRLRAQANRLVFGAAQDPHTVLSLVGARLRATEDAHTVSHRVLPELAAAVAGALRLRYTAIEVAGGETIEYGPPSAAAPGRSTPAGPAPRPELERIPLEYAGLPVGTLLLAPRPGGLRRTERRLLGDVARNAGVALHTVILARDVRRSREQLVNAREEERRRLHRELHDGFGPVLAAAALQAETARDLLPGDPAAAGKILDRVVPRLRGTVDDVRALVHGLRPPALDDLGLGPAVRELASRFAAPGLRVRVATADDLGALPAAAEVAVYRIVAEALTNAAKHAAAAEITVTLARSAAGLAVEIDDDGRGLPAAARPDGSAPRAGLGLASMRERVDELRGTFTIGPGRDGRGTRVSALLPTPAEG